LGAAVNSLLVYARGHAVLSAYGILTANVTTAGRRAFQDVQVALRRGGRIARRPLAGNFKPRDLMFVAFRNVDHIHRHVRRATDEGEGEQCESQAVHPLIVRLVAERFKSAEIAGKLETLPRTGGLGLP